jgi:hypothetical protein
MVDAHSIDLQAPSAADFKIAEELAASLSDAIRAKPGQQKLPTDVAKPHHGGHAAHPVESAGACGCAEDQLHAMLSYQWDWQDHVTRVRHSLNKKGIRTWLDIDGGIGQDLYESMAAGVTGASCVVAFIAPSYAESEKPGSNR